MQTGRGAGEERMGKRGRGQSGRKRKEELHRGRGIYKKGDGQKTETAIESKGHLPPPSGCRVHSLCEGYWSQRVHLKKVGFSRAQK